MKIVLEPGKEYLRAVEMLVCLCKLFSPPVKHREVIFDACLVTYMAGLLKVISSGGELDQRPVNVIFPVLRRPQILQDNAERIMEATNEAMILKLLKQWGGFCMNSPGIAVSLCVLLDDSDAK